MPLKLDASRFEREERLDAAQSVFFARELEEIDAQMYDVKYANLEAFELVPVKNIDPGAETYTYRQFDGRAIAVMTANYASGSPRADVDGKEFTSSVRSIRNSYGYNVQEIRAAQKVGRPLDNMRAVVARRGINEQINQNALLGNAEFGINGLFSQPNAQTFTPQTKTGGGTAWTGASVLPTEILNDLFGIVDQIPTSTSEVEHPTRLLLPYSRYRLISRLLIGASAPSMSILNFFKEQRPGIEVRGALFLDTAGTGGGTRMVAYDPKPETLQLILPVPFESFPPQLEGLEYIVENHARMGSVVARYPLTICYGDAI